MTLDRYVRWGKPVKPQLDTGTDMEYRLNNFGILEVFREGYWQTTT